MTTVSATNAAWGLLKHLADSTELITAIRATIPAPDVEPDWVNATDAAAEIYKSRSCVVRWARDGHIKSKPYRKNKLLVDMNQVQFLANMGNAGRREYFKQKRKEQQS